MTDGTALARALVAEAIGTFALVFAGCGAVMVEAKTHQLGHVGVAITFGLVKLRSDGRIHVRSAGSDPADRINPAVVEAMQEVGVDMAQEFPKPLTDEVVRAADVVVTMGCGDACPIYPGKKYEDWELEDPAERDLETVRLIRDEIEARVQRLIAELLPE